MIQNGLTVKVVCLKFLQTSLSAFGIFHFVEEVRNDLVVPEHFRELKLFKRLNGSLLTLAIETVHVQQQKTRVLLNFEKRTAFLVSENVHCAAKVIQVLCEFSFASRNN